MVMSGLALRGAAMCFLASSAHIWPGARLFRGHPPDGGLGIREDRDPLWCRLSP